MSSRKSSSGGLAGLLSGAAGGSGSASPSGSRSSSGSGVRRRSTQRTSASATSGLRFGFADDTSGLQIGPTVALVLSLSFIGFVILLHIWGKFTR